MGRAADDPQLPINLGRVGTDEYVPPPTSAGLKEVVRRAKEACDTNARRTGVSRREFLRTTCAAATTLVVLNACSDEANRSKGTSPGGTFNVPNEATTEREMADAVLGGDEFIFDVQGHLLDSSFDPDAAAEVDRFGAGFPQYRCGEHEPRDCFSIERFLEEMFLRSDTDMVVLSAVPVPDEHDPLSPQVMRETRRVAGALCHDDRVLLHGKASPSQGSLEAALARMESLATNYPIVGWKTYTHTGRGWWLDDHEAGAPQVGEAMIRKAVELEVPRIAVHKGLGNSYASPKDIGPAARAHGDVRFLVYHSGYEVNVTEGPYTPATKDDGINRLVASMERAGVGPNQNVYAELGTTWFRMMRTPTQAAHVLGKLLRFIGEDNVVWGTDSIWYGSPQDQIQAFRTFEISAELQERFGYPALTAERKAKVLGLNGARVYGVEPIRSRCTFTRRELLHVRRQR